MIKIWDVNALYCIFGKRSNSRNMNWYTYSNINQIVQINKMPMILKDFSFTSVAVYSTRNESKHI